MNLANEKISEWLKLIDMIKSGTETQEEQEGSNVEDQTLYLNIIASACIDKEERGIQKIQNSVSKDLFSGKGVKNGLIHFDVYHNDPHIIFCKPLSCTYSTFFFYNDPLTEIINDDLQVDDKYIFPI